VREEDGWLQPCREDKGERGGAGEAVGIGGGGPEGHVALVNEEDDKEIFLLSLKGYDAGGLGRGR
jgi:hypothetical protein